MSNPNITSNPSLSTKLSVWFRSIPLVTRCALSSLIFVFLQLMDKLLRCVVALCAIIYVGGLLFGTITGLVCHSPLAIIEKQQSKKRILSIGLLIFASMAVNYFGLVSWRHTSHLNEHDGFSAYGFWVLLMLFRFELLI